ncbi:hypothetical protein C6A85_000000101470 [Mycobacterium sp. ITM-2017-0098]|nr:hypothetical protein C6A85_000000101470 [Mycobacterium sp. ITM-2017-0098]
MRRVVDAYGVGTLREVTYVLDSVHFAWHDDFTRALASGDPIVGTLRAALAPTGMTADAQDLLILAWVALTDRELLRHGSPAGSPGIGGLANDVTLREPVLPSQEDWTNALHRAKAVFGIGASEHHLSSSAVKRVGDELVTKLRNVDRGATDLVGGLEAHGDVLGLGDVSPRLATGRRARDLIGALRDAADHVARIRVLAEFDLPGELQPLARSLASAADVSAALQGANWQLLNQLPTLAGERAANALTSLRSAAEPDQMHVDLAPALSAAAQEVTHILVEKRGTTARTDDDAEAEQERARREQEDRRRREQEEELKRREQEAVDRERRLREQEEEFRRRQEQAQREAEKRASQEHTLEVEGMSQLETLLKDLTQELSRPVEGKKLRVDWRWL